MCVAPERASRNIFGKISGNESTSRDAGILAQGSPNTKPRHSPITWSTLPSSASYAEAPG
jgi:hypothetical protein